MAGFAGLVQLATAIDVVVVAKNSSLVPLDSDSLPSYRIYGPSGILSSGSLALKDTGVITGVTNANPAVITCNGHGLVTGVRVVIAALTGTLGTALNGANNVTKIDSNTFSVAVDTSASSVYVSGGTWHSAGVYDFAFTPTIGANYAAGTVYNVVVYGTFSAVVQVVDSFTFQVT